MMRTEFHAPDLIPTLTFPANSAQQQLSLLTLVTHFLITSPILTPTLQQWNIVRHNDTYHQTLQLILATMTLKRYHTIWYTLLDTRQQPDISTPHSPRQTKRRRLWRIKHQLSSVNLATHFLFTFPILTQTLQSWNIVWHDDTYHQTLQPILATMTLT